MDIKILNYSFARINIEYLIYDLVFLKLKSLKKNFIIKYRISTPLIRENPVKSPKVPPMMASLSTNLAEVS